ncbi:MAG: hypothetical protein QOI66_4952 [Myxococcales bacterium]|jgi:hypothetical protein|nr:hypothetical protein [Myxococcales bacterium]
MKGFLLGLVVAGLVFGGYLYWKHRESLARVATASADGGAPLRDAGKDKKKRKRRGATGLARISDRAGDDGAAAGHGRRNAPQAAQPPIDPEPEPIKLSAADLKIVSQGDDLSRPDVVHLDMSDDSGSHELGQDDIDSRFRAKEEAILGCIAHARPDEETYVPGRVTVKFRIQRAGTVRGVRVDAPAILQRGGLTGCIKGVLGGLRFPPSNGSQVVSYPFSLS